MEDLEKFDGTAMLARWDESVVGMKDDDLTLARLGQSCADPVSLHPIFLRMKMGTVGDRMKICLAATPGEVKCLAYLKTLDDGP